MNRLIIARHGNTFESGEEPRRVAVKDAVALLEQGQAALHGGEGIPQLGHLVREVSR